MEYKNFLKQLESDIKGKSYEEIKKLFCIGGELTSKYKNIIAFHGTQQIEQLHKAIKDKNLHLNEGRYGKGFYLTSTIEAAEYYGKQRAYFDEKGSLLGRKFETEANVDVFPFFIGDLKSTNVEEYQIDYKGKYMENLGKEGYELVYIDVGEIVCLKPNNLKYVNLKK